MKIPLTFLLLFIHTCLSAQVKIHAHNDYEKPHPLTNALANKVYIVEADVFLRDGELLVAHSDKDISKERSLNALYLDPIIALFKKYKGQIAADEEYHPSLMIDVKDGGAEKHQSTC